MARRARIAWVFAACLPAAQGAAAQVLPQRPSAQVPASDPAFDAMKAGFEALAESERKALQDALVWTGDYNSVVTGAFGRRTFEALNAFRARANATDALDARTRAAILAAGEAARRAARFTVKPDPGSGAVLGVPERLLTKRGALPGGTRWQSADGRFTLESRSFPAGETDLDALFARATAPLNDRRVTYKLKRPDFVVVTAETGAGRSYTRYAAGSEGIRGFAIGYDRAMAVDLDRLVIAIANSFTPFPDAGAIPGEGQRPAATPAANAASSPVKLPLTPAAPPGPAPRPVAVQAVGTGLVVAAGRVLTSSAVPEACPALRVGTAPARLVRSDPARGLALLEAVGLPPARLPAARTSTPDPDEALVVVAADGSGVSVAPGSGSGAAGVVAPLQPGAGGAPVLDRTGALAGIVARFPAAPRLVAGVMPPARFALVPGAAVAAFLAENGVSASGPVGGGGSLGAAAARVDGSVLGLTCAR
ncbi:serine protease [uncultured Methylobacterium sp.]|uniref:serine protease n=1 Tax=uncultured Methylobacterium sp. TaxID=157278 RepID=UPI0035CA9C72